MALSGAVTSGQNSLPGAAAQGITVAAPNGMLLSTLVKAEVKDAQGIDLGIIEDMVLDWRQGEVAYSILATGGLWGFGATWYAIPLHDLQMEPFQSALILDVTAEMLQIAPGIDQTVLPTTVDPTWTTDIRQYWEMHQKLVGTK